VEDDGIMIIISMMDSEHTIQLLQILISDVHFMEAHLQIRQHIHKIGQDGTGLVAEQTLAQ
jgi:hypothetical protein